MKIIVSSPIQGPESRGHDRTGEANAEALRRIVAAQPILVDLKPAGEVIPGLAEHDLLHAGPPLAGWEEASGALRGSILGALVHSGLARDITEGEVFAASGGIRLLPANDHHAGGTYAGVIARGTPVFVVENRADGARACAALNEGRGKALRYGANDTDTLARLAWLEGEFAQILGAAIRLSGGIDLFEILVQALHMGDDGHSRQKAASALFMSAISPHVVETGVGAKEAAHALRFLARNDIFFLPLTMAAGKATMESAQGIPGSTVVTCMSANGVRFGIKVSGLGDRWVTAAVPSVHGRLFEGYRAQDANPVIGDSEIAETMGLGAFAMAGAPALARYVGGTPEEATRLALEMYSITLAEHPRFTIPALGFRGTPTAIDVRQVVERGLAPIFNTGIAHRMPGIGQIGAGFARTPLECYTAALAELHRLPLPKG
ncbi:MAG: DUF1116 domain-containing protein [Candidatus Methylomirabilia bacterium]